MMEKIVEGIYKRLFRSMFKKRIDFVEEGGIYKATRGTKSWYIPSNDRTQAVWVLNFMSLHERYLDALQKGDTVIEVGTATGEYTIPAAKKIGRDGQIHAFEVEPMSYLCLKKNLALNNLVNVKPVNRAASDKSNKSLWLSFRKGGLADASFHRQAPEKILVKTISLDDYATSIGMEKVNVLKVTINGHEPEVVKGAKNLLGGGGEKRYIPVR
ncbi:MAG: FkbM family methyltransferase [Candidatus Omnitrophica bacterium]|nr:FkbM family methyltransferase [Candidatus Omnitrophota bacterium]